MPADEQQLMKCLSQTRNNVHHVMQIVHTQDLTREPHINTIKIILRIINRQMQEVSHIIENYNRYGGDDEVERGE